MTQTTLNQLQAGQMATVTGLLATGLGRRRLMDLGILPGTQIQIEFKSPLGDPIAYRIRETLIALRESQSKNVEIAIQGETP